MNPSTIIEAHSNTPRGRRGLLGLPDPLVSLVLTFVSAQKKRPHFPRTKFDDWFSFDCVVTAVNASCSLLLKFVYSPPAWSGVALPGALAVFAFRHFKQAVATSEWASFMSFVVGFGYIDGRVPTSFVPSDRVQYIGTLVCDSWAAVPAAFLAKAGPLVRDLDLGHHFNDREFLRYDPTMFSFASFG